MKPIPNITSGPIIKTIFALAIPAVLGMIMEIALGVVNFFWVGKLGPAAQDAITSSMTVHWAAFSAISLVTIGSTALVARHVGAKEPEKATAYVHQALWLALLIGVVITAVGEIFGPKLLVFMNTGSDTMAQAVPYLRIFFGAAILFAIIDTCFAVFRAAGDTRTPMIVAGAAIALNMVLDPLFIFGLGPFPELGVPGASVANFISITVGTLTMVILLAKGKAGFAVPGLFRVRPHVKSIVRIARIGAPIATQQLIFIIVYWFLIRVVHHFGEAGGAAMGIGNRMESLSYFTCSGFAIAASAMVGQNLGAGNPDRAERCAWGSMLVAVAITACIGLVFVTIPNHVASIFTNNSEVHHIAADYLFILGLSQVTMAVEIVLEGSFSGAGDTVPPMLVLIPGAIVRVPLAYYLAFDAGWGINGVWWTLTITTTIKATILALWFKRGNWKYRKL